MGFLGVVTFTLYSRGELLVQETFFQDISDTFPQWRQKLFIGALKDKEVIVLSIKGNTVTEDGRLLQERGQRIRDVRVGPDGYLYVLTDESDGELLKVSP